MVLKNEEIHLLISGQVQGVGFRYSTRQKARALGVRGWVRNTPDGRVEITAEGGTESIEALLQWCQSGPPASRVTNVEVVRRNEAPEIVFSEFEVRYN